MKNSMRVSQTKTAHCLMRSIARLKRCVLCSSLSVVPLRCHLSPHFVSCLLLQFFIKPKAPKGYYIFGDVGK